MKSIWLWNSAGAVFTIGAGTLLHFVSGRFDGKLWSVVGSVNESTWEHLKLIFWPMVIFSLIEYFFYGKNTAGFIQIRALSIILGMFIIVSGFYTYTGIVGKNFFYADIGLFVIAVTAAYLFAALNMGKDRRLYSSSFLDTVAIAIITTAGILFVLFTQMPPELPLFKAPVQ